MSELPLDSPETPPLLTPLTKFFFHNLSGQSIQTSMQNLESVAQKWLNYPLTPLRPPLLTPLTKKNSHNLLCQFIQTSMQNLETVAQKMAELPLDAPETPLLMPLTKKNLIICYDSSYELPCKIWKL